MSWANRPTNRTGTNLGHVAFRYAKYMQTIQVHGHKPRFQKNSNRQPCSSSTNPLCWISFDALNHCFDICIRFCVSMEVSCLCCFQKSDKRFKYSDNDLFRFIYISDLHFFSFCFSWMRCLDWWLRVTLEPLKSSLGFHMACQLIYGVSVARHTAFWRTSLIVSEAFMVLCCLWQCVWTCTFTALVSKPLYSQIIYLDWYSCEFLRHGHVLKDTFRRFVLRLNFL